MCNFIDFDITSLREWVGCGGSDAFTDGHVFVQKPKTAVSHSSTDAEITCVDAGSRVEGISALMQWATDIFGVTPKVRNNSMQTQPKHEQTLDTTHRLFSNIDHATMPHEFYAVRTKTTKP